ncbi:MAG TPA: hypothetical protein VGY56_20350 [Verrucomicrobiae bacterium]|nr:hypothetical protein [Verrucomicrobiae bacterium]
MNTRFDPEQLQNIYGTLDDFEGTGPWNTRELETAMEALASQIYFLIGGEEEPRTLADAIRTLPIEKKSKRQLIETCNELQEAMDATDYDSDEDEIEDTIENSKNDLYYMLLESLRTLEKKE